MLHRIFGCLPWRICQAAGALVGLAGYALAFRQRALAIEHLAGALPGIGPRDRKRIIRRVFKHLGMNLFEWFKIPALSLEQIGGMVRAEGVENLRAAMQGGRGAICLSGHIGNWELLHLYFRSLGYEGCVVARPLRYPEYEHFLITLRERKGVATLKRGGSFRSIAQQLREGRIVGIVPDQDIESVEGVFVDFFGRPAHTPMGPAMLSLLTGAPIVPCFIVREGGGFKIIADPPLAAPEQASDRESAIRALTQSWSNAVERVIRAYPDQWVWMHRRWKTQSAG